MADVAPIVGMTMCFVGTWSGLPWPGRVRDGDSSTLPMNSTTGT